MNKTFLRILIVIGLTTLACSIFVGGPLYPSTPIPVSSDAAQSLHEQLDQALATGTQTGSITLRISESQLTSYLTYYLGTQADPVITNPEVLLRNGQAQIFGEAQGGLLTANISLTLQVNVDAAGRPQIVITKTDFGPLPVPPNLDETVSTLIQEAFTGALGPAATGFRLETVSLSDGFMTVTGRVR